MSEALDRVEVRENPPTTESLISISSFVQAYPPGEPYAMRATQVVYLSPHSRFRVIREQTPDIGYGLYRDEALADVGISAADLDARAFAEGLFEALADDLSCHILRELATVFQAKSAEWDAALEARRKSVVR